ncbi:hypothetical protein INT45_006717 [Circinella minor]|uniref:Uncharacterized protein n=1 Tax=Circinella minor TaxID=1195481 RepID=A0A8H7S344_9FUNG|nr:hypothetical protein INT45_006717 [Circinella minor]
MPSNSYNFTFIDKTEIFTVTNSGEDIQKFLPTENSVADPVSTLLISLQLKAVHVDSPGEKQGRRKPTERGDYCLIEETIRVNPFLLKGGGKGTSVRDDAWKKIAERVNYLVCLDGTTGSCKPVDTRYAKERISQLRKKAEKQRHLIRYGSGKGGRHDTRLERCYKDLLKIQDSDAAAIKKVQDE